MCESTNLRGGILPCDTNSASVRMVSLFARYNFHHVSFIVVKSAITRASPFSRPSADYFRLSASPMPMLLIAVFRD